MSDDENNDLPRLIASFPGVDIGVLSTALERGGNLTNASALIREMIGTSSNSDLKKPRPTGSARRREQKITSTALVNSTNEMEINTNKNFSTTNNTNLGLSKSQNIHKSDTGLYVSPKQSMNTLAEKNKSNFIGSNNFEDTKSHDDLYNNNNLILEKNFPRSGKVENLINDHNQIESESRSDGEREEDSEEEDHIINMVTKAAINEAALVNAKNDTKRPAINLHQASAHSPTNSTRTHPYTEDEDDQSESDEDGREYMEKTNDDDAPLQQQIQKLFTYTTSFQPETIELFAELKCFIPDFIPAIGDIDPMIKIPQPMNFPKGQKSSKSSPVLALGLSVLDEPATKQSDPAVLDLQLRAISKGSPTSGHQNIRSIQLNFDVTDPNAQKGKKALEQWVQNVYDLHVHKPPDKVEYSKRMPDVETLMEEWPEKIQEALHTNSIKLPTSDIDLKLEQFTKICCNILDIPINIKYPIQQKDNSPAPKVKSHSYIESLHLLFTLYSEFKNSQHFGKKT
ncbi:Intraflagellar transport protein 46 [Clydaea vesicula]|uniref:Intraflagellar transport protein 46 n=1 Tax=Clydaea vesicula TaxID=447962 RepID=A0AAD5U3E8_9FUNG|nr:Intraflagellar transport protein 46 [Clydaea vesicula]KAJ3393839.1 Intraflagellar transport protein 46 [Lobulomyces angularis]